MAEGRPNELIAFGSIRGITREHFARLWKEACSNRYIASCDKSAYRVKFIKRQGALRLSMWADQFETSGNWQVEANPSTFAMKLKTDGSMTTEAVERTCKSLCDKFQEILNELLRRNSQDSDIKAEIHCKAALTFEGNTMISYDVQKNSSKSVRIDQAPKVAYMVWSILLLLNELDIQIRLSEELHEHISTTGLVPENLREAKVSTSTKFETITEWKNLLRMYEDTKINLISSDLNILSELRKELANLGDGSLTDLLNPLFEEIEQCQKRYSSQLKQTNAIADNFQRAIKSAEEFLATERLSEEARRTLWAVIVGIFASVSGITVVGLVLRTFWTDSLKIPQEGTVMEVLMGLVSRISQHLPGVPATLQPVVGVAIVGVAILVVLIFLFLLVRLAISGASSVYSRYLKVLMGVAQATQNFIISFSVTRRQQRSFATEIENLITKMRNNRDKTYLFLSRNAPYAEKILLTDLKKIFGELIISEDVATEGSNFGIDDCLESSGTTVIVVGGPVSNLATRCVELKCDCPFDFAFNPNLRRGKYVIRRKKGNDLLTEKRESGFVQIVTQVPPNGTKDDEITIIYIAGTRGIHTVMAVEYLNYLLRVAKTKSILERLLTKLNRQMKPSPKAMLVHVKGDEKLKPLTDEKTEKLQALRRALKDAKLKKSMRVDFQ